MKTKITLVMIPIFTFYVLFSELISTNLYASTNEIEILEKESNYNNNILQINSTEPFTPIYGFESQMAVDPPEYGSNIYISNSDSFFVSKFDTGGVLINSHFVDLSDNPGALATDFYGDLYIGKKNGGIARYQRISGTLNEYFISGVRASCIFVNTNYDTVVYVSDTTKQRIEKYSSISGELIDSLFITGVNATAMELWGNFLYVSLGTQNKIKVFNSVNGDYINQTEDNDTLVKHVYSLTMSADTTVYFPYFKDTLVLLNDTLRNAFQIYLVGIKADSPYPSNISLWAWIPIAKVVFVVALIAGVVYAGYEIYTAGVNLVAQHERRINNDLQQKNQVQKQPAQGVNQITQPPQPVELSTFVASVNQRTISLSWETFFEVNNFGFEIERSLGNEEYTKIGFVNGSGNSTEPRNYSFIDRNLNSGIYNYRLKQIDFNGNYEFFDLSEEVVIGIPDKFSLHQNYPNPYNPVTKIRYDLPVSGNISLKIYDNTGREIKTLISGFKDAGYYTVEFNGSGIASGVYYYKIESGNFIATKKMVLLK